MQRSQVGSGRYHPSRASGRPGEVDTRLGGAQGCYTLGWSPGKSGKAKHRWQEPWF